MRKVKTELDMTIRTKKVRSFSARGSWRGKSSRGHPAGQAVRRSKSRKTQRQIKGAVRYREEGIAALSSSHRRILQQLPDKVKRQLLARTERKIDRSIRAGRYKDPQLEPEYAQIHTGSKGGEENPGAASALGDLKERAGSNTGKKISHDYARTLGRLIESQVRFTRQFESSQEDLRKQRTIQEMEEAEARRVSRIVSFSLKRTKTALHGLSASAKLLASKGKRYLVLLLVPVVLLVMIVPLLLSSVSMTEEEATASITAAELVEYALSWVGITQYIYGEGRAYETDWQDYTDCSGYVHGVFSHFGYEIGSDTVTMESSGTLVDTNSIDQALPGDIILFFRHGIRPGNSTHVGIYIGKGQMVHCSGGPANVSPATAGPGVMVRLVSQDKRPYQVRRIIQDALLGGTGSGGHRVDPTVYTVSDLQLIWAIVAQEDNGSYEGALAVISSAMNRTESPVWSYLGDTAMKQLCAPGQYCYSNDHYWEARLGGNVPEYVKQAVNDCLIRGIRNHSFTCFRSRKGAATGPDAVQIGGNWFFGT